MSLQDYVVDVETAKKLEEKGFGKETDLYWFRYKKTSGKVDWSNWKIVKKYEIANYREYYLLSLIPTYILEQVMEALPRYIEFKECKAKEYHDTKCNPNCIHRGELIINLSNGIIGYLCLCKDVIGFKWWLKGLQIEDSINPATAAAKLWLWAKEMGHVKYRRPI